VEEAVISPTVSMVSGNWATDVVATQMRACLCSEGSAIHLNETIGHNGGTGVGPVMRLV
jgi:hypothetical protein